MGELQQVSYLLLVGTALVLLVTSVFPPRERTWLLVSWIAHITSAYGQTWLTLDYYGYGDIWTYSQFGLQIGEWLRDDFWNRVEEIIKLYFQQPSRIPFPVQGAGTPTGSMAALTGLLSWASGGSLLTCCIAFCLTSYFGKLALYLAFRDAVPIERVSLLTVTMLVPSVVFWTSAPLKETVALTGLGIALLGLRRIIADGKSRYIGLVACGIILVGYSKAYILMVAFVATSTLYLLQRVRKSRNVLTGPVYFILLSIATLSALYLTGSVFERFSAESVVLETVKLQSLQQGGGSDYSLGMGAEPSLATQAIYAPLALVTSLFRPFIFEVRGVLPLVNAGETFVFLLLTLRFVLVRRMRGIVDTLTNPWCGFALIFTLVLGVGVGLTTTNLGTLSRYRAPLVPFFLVVLLLGEKRRKFDIGSPP